MPASEILRIALTVGTVQMLCDIAAHYSVYQTEQYKRQLATLAKAKARLDKEKAVGTATATTSAKGKDKLVKRLKQIEDDHANCKGIVAQRHIVPGICTSILFFILARVLGADLHGTILGILPFTPFKFLRRVTARGLDFDDVFEGTDLVNDTSQACGFMFVYLLSSMSIKFYVNKLFGTCPPANDAGLFGFLDSPQGQKVTKSLGFDPADFRPPKDE
jgi:hypothetical protein